MEPNPKNVEPCDTPDCTELRQIIWEEMHSIVKPDGTLDTAEWLQKEWGISQHAFDHLVIPLYRKAVTETVSGYRAIAIAMVTGVLVERRKAADRQKAAAQATKDALELEAMVGLGAPPAPIASNAQANEWDNVGT